MTTPEIDLKTIIIRFAVVAEQPNSRDDARLSALIPSNHLADIKRYTGFVRGRDLIPLFGTDALEANPRSAKVGQVTDEILKTLSDTPELFPFKSKGILLGTSNYASLQRNRFELSFNDPSSEGILDGGHNMLAIGIFMLSFVATEKEIKSVKLWEDLMSLWETYEDAIEDCGEEFNFLIPVELLVPSEVDDPESVAQFEMSVLDICAARNNNSQLTQETKSNKLGLYEDLRQRLNKEIEDRVEWKSNEWDSSESRPIKVRDLLALSWIPLNKANEFRLLPIDISVTPQNIYRNKGECSKAFDRLMTDDRVTSAVDGVKRELIHPTVGSCFDILADLPHLYDKLYAEFPDAYNANNYRFGANPIVKIYDPERREAASDKTAYIATQPTTPFTHRPVRHRFPDGLIMPLVYGLKGIMEVQDDEIIWAVDPFEFLDKNLVELAGSYRLVLDMARFDPQKLSKNPASHQFAVSQYEALLARQTR